MTAIMVNASPFAIRGAMESFYGTYFTFPERNDLIRFLGRHGFNFYLYGPKNDRQHRMRWWDPYPPAILDQFAETISIARECGVTFCYAISFGVPLDYGSQEQFDIVTEKLRAFYDRGCRAFSVLLDDLTDPVTHDVTGRIFPSLAAAHADFCNRLLAWTRCLDEHCSLSMCPTEYHGCAPFSPTLHELGRLLDPEIDLFYTGPDIASPRITRADVAAFAKAARRPPLIWDNYPVNDLSMRPEMHLAPLRGRDPHLAGVCRGFVSNLMGQAEACKVPLRTVAEYLADPAGYDAEAAWRQALRHEAGADAFDSLVNVATNMLSTCWQVEQAPTMTLLTSQALASLQRGESATCGAAVQELTRYFDTLDEACYALKNRMSNVALRNSLLPWIEALEDKLWLGRGAVQTARTIEAGEDFQPSVRVVEGLLADVQRNPKHVGGTAVEALASFVLSYAREVGGITMFPVEQPSVTSAELASVPGSHPSHGHLGMQLDVAAEGS